MPVNPRGESNGYMDLCMEFGTTWFYTFANREWLGNVDERIRMGPPRGNR